MKKNKLPKKKKTNVASNLPQKSSSSFIMVLLVLTAIAATSFSYSPIKNNKLTNWDDDKYIINNPDIRKLDSEHLKLLLTKNYEGNYHPVTMLSIALNYSTGQLNPQTYLYTNLFFHLLNVLLVFIFTRKLTGQIVAGFIAAILFGIHPLHVESVAWASERKDVLYCFFFLLSLIAYLQYLKKSRWVYFIISLVFFALSLLSKAMAVPLAVVIIFIDFFYSRKFSLRLIWEKIPFFALAIISGMIAIQAQEVKDFVSDDSQWTLIDRVAIASNNFINYIIQLIAPHDLSVFYPYPETLKFYHWLSFGLVILVLAAFLYFIVRKYPFIASQKIYLFGFLFFVVNIFLVLQILPVGNAILADRYTYVSYIGLFIIVGFFIERVTLKFKNYRPMIYGALAVYLLFLAIFTYERTSIWRDSPTLWNETIKNYPSAVAYVNLGLAKEKVNIEEAYRDFKKASELDPNYALAWHNMGAVQLPKKQYDSAIAYLNRAISLNPDYRNSYGARGEAKFNIGDYQGAIEDYDQFISRFQGHPGVYFMRGQAKHNLKNYQSAIGDFTKAIEVGTKAANPNVHLYYNQRGVTKGLERQFESAMEDYKKAIGVAPAYAEAYYNLGNLEYYLGEATNDPEKKAAGCAHLKRASELGNRQALVDAARLCK
ncbi:MAG TPA: tetratricopeptide repeat protein [Chitinophagaceae bacterium]|nr:tetratricopeptide repeat protein [Chitinophagaceae bacterium]